MNESPSSSQPLIIGKHFQPRNANQNEGDSQILVMVLYLIAAFYQLFQFCWYGQRVQNEVNNKYAPIIGTLHRIIFLSSHSDFRTVHYSMPLAQLEHTITELGIRLRLVQVFEKVQNNAAHILYGRSEDGGHQRL